MHEWVTAGYVVAKETKGRGNPLLFELIYDLDTIKEKTGVSLDITKIAEDKRLKFQTEANSFLDSFRKKISYGREWTEQKVRERIQSLDAHPWENFFQNKPNEESSLESENKVMTSAISPMSKVESLDSQKKPFPSDSLTIQETLILLRSAWKKGSYTDFDDLVMTTRNCPKENAEQLREKWLDEGLIAYDSKGWLVLTR